MFLFDNFISCDVLLFLRSSQDREISKIFSFIGTRKKQYFTAITEWLSLYIFWQTVLIIRYHHEKGAHIDLTCQCNKLNAKCGSTGLLFKCSKL